MRIWSAGCASGEEIYTIAMLLAELLPDIDQWTLNILGTDLNTNSLRKALLGKYNKWSMRSVENYFKEKYFKQQGNEYFLDQKIIDLANFNYLNLNSDSYPAIYNSTNAQDLILCRNVLIYFDGNHIKNLMKKLYLSLVPGGYLILGASDPIVFKDTPFIYHQEQGTLLSRPKEEKTDLSQKMTAKKLARPLTSNKAPSKIIANSTKSSVAEKNQNIEQLISEAIALSNLGKLASAVQIFQKCLTLESTNKHTYFMYALALSELNQVDKAEDAFRKTLFLDHQFVSGHYQLGLLLLRNKQQLAGLKCLRNALMLAKAKNPSEIAQGSNELTYGRLTEMLECEINLYSVKINHKDAS